jgi:two-component system, LytTR family, response regulator
MEPGTAAVAHMTSRIIVADDEAVARRRLLRFLAERDDVEVVAECSGGRAAVEAINRLAPDVVLLDVQMPDLDGFDVLALLELERVPAIVFVTAHDQYALKAFDAAAVDYLLKPYEPERFNQAVDRAIRSSESAARGDAEAQLRQLLNGIRAERQMPTDDVSLGGRLDRFMVKRRDRTQFVRASDVDWLEADGNYVRLHVGTAHHLVRATIANCEDRLDPKMFVRTHRRFIVNIERIKEVQPWFGGDYVIVLQSGHKLRLSRSFRERFQARMVGGQAI